jgi:Protein of unknown function (DUF3991)/Toprim-like
VTRDDFRPNHFRHRADLVREIPLEVVLRSWGAVRDRLDKSQWRTRRGPLSVTGTKFFNWHASQGGGGAIDLVMHLGGWDAGQAIEWLWHHYGDSHVAGTNLAVVSDFTFAPSPTQPVERHRDFNGNDSPSQLRLPASSRANLERVRQYLQQRRSLSQKILASLIDAGRLYADNRGNAVFLMMAGKPNRPIGAELRGTGSRAWRGLAPGTRRNAGYFWIGRAEAKNIVLCESAIDAISCFQLQTQHAAALKDECICISTAGVRPDAPWLRPLLARGYTIHCGFDTDEPGETASRQMIASHPAVQRLRPAKHDWNETLTAANE